jgi:hypothetical protein
MHLALVADINDMKVVTDSTSLKGGTIVMVKQKTTVRRTNQSGTGDQSIREAIAVNQHTRLAIVL